VAAGGTPLVTTPGGNVVPGTGGTGGPVVTPGGTIGGTVVTPGGTIGGVVPAKCKHTSIMRTILEILFQHLHPPY